jgi:aminoglycoside phosphotransferase (APT) family kinase protein
VSTDPAGLKLVGLTHWLGNNIAGFDTSSTVNATLLAGGRSNVSYKLTDGVNNEYVLRRPPLGNIMPTAHDMGREFRVLSGLNSVSFPTPTALAHCEDESVIGAHFMVMDFVDGLVVSDANDAARLDSHQAERISQSLISTLAKLHTLNPQAAGLVNLGKPDGYLLRQASRWIGQWELTKTRQLPGILELHQWITEQLEKLPANLPWGIVHGDFRIDNVILDRNNQEILAVLDWEMSTLGDPISDLAISLVYWSEKTDTLRKNIPVAEHVTEGDGFWTREKCVQQYVEYTGFGIEHLDVCVALACFKLAVIMESIHKRNLEGLQLGAASGKDSNMGLAAESLTELGLATIELGAFGALTS